MRRTVLGLLLGGSMLAASMTALPAIAASAATEAHDHGDAAHALKLNDGKKWASDAPLREGMSQIRAAVAASAPTLHDKPQPAAFDALGQKIDVQIGDIVRNCKLEPAADEVLHVILAELTQASEGLQGKNEKLARSDALDAVVHSLQTYNEYFEHPGFEPIRSGH